MPVECCGKPASTQFCPQCGRRLGEPDPLVRLFAFCRAHQAICEWRCLMRGGPRLDGSDVDLRRAARWKLWGDALAKLIGGDV